MKFNWTATVAVDGTVTKTPFTITEAPIQNLSPKAAKSMVKDAAKAMGRKLNGTELARAADIFMRNADGFPPLNAKCTRAQCKTSWPLR